MEITGKQLRAINKFTANSKFMRPVLEHVAFIDGYLEVTNSYVAIRRKLDSDDWKHEKGLLFKAEDIKRLRASDKFNSIQALKELIPYEESTEKNPREFEYGIFPRIEQLLEDTQKAAEGSCGMFDAKYMKIICDLAIAFSDKYNEPTIEINHKNFMNFIKINGIDEMQVILMGMRNK